MASTDDEGAAPAGAGLVLLAQDRRRRPGEQRRTLLLLALLSLAVGAVGCRTVEYYEKRSFSLWVMQLEESPSEQHFHQKIYYSVEGSAGGIGTKAGGGCGCY